MLGGSRSRVDLISPSFVQTMALIPFTPSSPNEIEITLGSESEVGRGDGGGVPRLVKAVIRREHNLPFLALRAGTMISMR